MTYLDFQRTFKSMPVISAREISKHFPGYDLNALTRWQRKGYIHKIRNGYYRFADSSISGDKDLFFISNQIYQPSYISLQSAFRWYDFIPEGVFTPTAVSTRKTLNFMTPSGLFSYKTIKQKLFWGYNLMKYGELSIKIANPEKAFLDFLYLYPHIENEEDFFELRLNIIEINARLNWDRMDSYLTIYNVKSLTSRVEKLKLFLGTYA